MRNKVIILILAGLSLTAILFGCSDRGTNAPVVPAPSAWWVDDAAKHVFSPQLRFQIRNQDQLLGMTMYTPRVSWPPSYGGESRKVPLLVLLPPQEGDQYYYLHHGLFDLVEEMIAAGDIQPMAILTLSNDPVFGGYFYGNSYGAGFYDSLLGDALMEYVETQYGSKILSDPSQHAIGGVGQGAYGAFRAAIKHPGVYSAISVLDGPLDFDGANGSSGLMDLFDSVIAEQGNAPADFFEEYDSLSSQPLSRMFTGGSIAFSPLDTLLEVTVDTVDTNANGVTVPKKLTYFIDNRYQVADSTTLVGRLVGPGPADIFLNENNGFDFALPFDATGNVYQPVWDRWLANNLENLSGAGTNLNDVAIWIGTTPEAAHGFYQQTQSWITFLNTSGYDPEVRPYRGTPDRPAREGEYVYDRLREMLIFHSQNFNN